MKVPDYLAEGRALASLKSDLADLDALTELTKNMAENADRREKRMAELEAEVKSLRIDALIQGGCIQMAEERYGVALEALTRIANAIHDVTGGPEFARVAEEAVAKCRSMP